MFAYHSMIQKSASLTKEALSMKQYTRIYNAISKEKANIEHAESIGPIKKFVNRVLGKPEVSENHIAFLKERQDKFKGILNHPTQDVFNAFPTGISSQHNKDISEHVVDLFHTTSLQGSNYDVVKNRNVVNKTNILDNTNNIALSGRHNKTIHNISQNEHATPHVQGVSPDISYRGFKQFHGAEWSEHPSRTTNYTHVTPLPSMGVYYAQGSSNSAIRKLHRESMPSYMNSYDMSKVHDKTPTLPHNYTGKPFDNKKDKGLFVQMSPSEQQVLTDSMISAVKDKFKDTPYDQLHFMDFHEEALANKHQLENNVIAKYKSLPEARMYDKVTQSNVFQMQQVQGKRNPLTEGSASLDQNRNVVFHPNKRS